MASSSNAPASKRQKQQVASERTPIDVLTLGSGKRCSMAAKSAILKELKDMKYLPPDLAVSRSRIAAARSEVANRETPFGPLLIHKLFNTAEHGELECPVQNPLAMLYVAMSESPRFSHYVRCAMQAHGPPSLEAPWSIVIYVDEITCGNPLAVRSDARRKVQGVYWTLYQLGPQALADDMCWMEIVAFKTATTKDFVGCISHMLDVCLSCFFNEQGHDLRRGALFRVQSHGPFMLFLCVEMLIADIPALCESIGAMGTHGHVPCFYCRRILGWRAFDNPKIAALHGFNDLACIDQRQWGKHTNASLLQLLRDLQTTATTDPGALAKKQTLNGFKHMEGNFLLNPLTVNSKPLQVLMVDWMHLMFQSGCWNREVYQILATATTRQVKAYELLTTYVDAFTFPHNSKGAKSLLRPEHWASCRDAKPPVFKSTASDGLTLYLLFGKFFDDVLLRRLQAGTALHDLLQLQVSSYHRLSEVIDLLQLSKFGHNVSPDLLDRRIHAWRLAHAAAYAKTLTYLKNHLVSHLPDCMRARLENSNFAMLVACWALDPMCVCMHK